MCVHPAVRSAELELTQGGHDVLQALQVAEGAVGDSEAAIDLAALVLQGGDGTALHAVLVEPGADASQSQGACVRCHKVSGTGFREELTCAGLGG